MKNIILKSFVALAIIIGLNSCSNEKDLSYSTPSGSFMILSPTSGESVTLNPANPTNPALALAWDKMNYGTPTQINYSVEIDKAGDNFDTPVELTSTTNNYITISTADLNGKGLLAGLTPFTQGGLDIRIKSTVGTTGAEPAYSNTVTYLVTPYTTEAPRLYVIGNFLANSGYGADWTTANTLPYLASSAYGKTDFEGYVNFNQASFEYKFLPTNTSFDGDWGDDSSFSGTLLQTGEVNCQGTGAGYYYLKANTGVVSATNPDGLKYTATKVNWGIIGAATPLGWGSSTPLSYDPVTKKWSGAVTMTAGEFKFRANDQWTTNLGGGTGNYMAYDGSNLSIPTGGTYNVVLDLSNPRKYTYTLTAQ